MLPGYVAGYYSLDESHIDLGRLAAFAGARLIHAAVQSLDLQVGSVRSAPRFIALGIALSGRCL